MSRTLEGLPVQPHASLNNKQTAPTLDVSEIIRCTSSLIHSFWHKDIITCLAFMDPEVICLGTIGRYGRYLDDYMDGKVAVASALKRWQESDLPPLALEYEKYSVSTLDSGFAVLVKNTIVDKTQAKTPSPLTILASLVWTCDSTGTLVLNLCHLSSNLPEDFAEPNEYMVEQKLPDYVVPTVEPIQPTAAHPSNQQDSLQITDAKSVTHWVAPESIMYASAAHQYTVVHCRDREIKVRGSITSVCEFLGELVVRVHRSYAVNPLYIDHMKGEMLFLIDGTKIPIPTRNVRRVRLSLSKYFKSVGE